MNKLITIMLCLLIADECFSRIIPFTEAEEQACSEHVNDMQFYCRIAVLDNFGIIKQTYTIPNEESDYIFKLCTEREVRKAAHNYIDRNDMVRVKEKQQIDSIYQDRIDSCLMPYNSKVAGAMIQYFLRLAKTLDIEEGKRQKILSLGLNVSRGLRKEPCYNYDIPVMKTLKKLLTRKQLHDIIDSKNAKAAVAHSKCVWQELKDNSIVVYEDSTKELPKMITYYLMEMRINDLYVDNEVMRQNNLSDLWRNQPATISLYESKKRKKNMMKAKQVGTEEKLIW